MVLYRPRTALSLRWKIARLLVTQVLTVVNDTTHVPLSGLPSGEITLAFRVSPSQQSPEK